MQHVETEQKLIIKEQLSLWCHLKLVVCETLLDVTTVVLI
jgi:hypothetical protein